MEIIMLGKQYIVRHGDTLWDISAKELGDPLKWPELFEHNNQNKVVANTGMKIADPDLIFVGQKLFIPGNSPVNKRPTQQKPPKPNTAKKKAFKKVSSVPFKYNLDDLPPQIIVSPLYMATISLKGSITIQSTRAIDFVTLNQKGFELAIKKETDVILGKLVSETQLGFNASTNEITFECGITAHSKVAYVPSTKLSAGVSSTTGLPVLKGSIIAHNIKGKINKHVYSTSDLMVEIEITQNPAASSPETVPAAKPMPVEESRSGWDYLLGGALIVGAGLLVAGTIVEDVVTFGAGIADDAPSFAAAVVMFTAGTVMFKTVNAGTAIKIE